MTERASRSEFEWLGMSWPGHREPDPQREEYLTLRARTTCLDFVVAAFAASLTKTLDRAAFVDLMNEGTMRFSREPPPGFAPTLPGEERDGQWPRVRREFAELRSLIDDLSWRD